MIYLVEDRENRPVKQKFENNFSGQLNDLNDSFKSIDITVNNEAELKEFYNTNLKDAKAIIFHKTHRVTDRIKFDILKEFFRDRDVYFIVFSGDSHSLYFSQKHKYAELPAKYLYSNNLIIFLREYKENNKIEIYKLFFGDGYENNLKLGLKYLLHNFTTFYPNNQLNKEDFEYFTGLLRKTIFKSLINDAQKSYNYVEKHIKGKLDFSHFENFLFIFQELEGYEIEVNSYNNVLIISESDLEIHDTNSLFNKYLKNIREKIKENNLKSIFIPTVINEKLANLYLGVELALHIKLDEDKALRSIPIILLGVEELSDFIKNCSYSDILKLDQVYYIKFLSSEISNFIKEKSSLLADIGGDNFLENIKKIHIEPPTNYPSHHSIDNELALFRWSKYIGLDIPEVEDKIKTNLYFKYINSIHPTEIQSENKQFFINAKHKTKILLIDDEAEKGWANFYKKFFQLSPNIKFDFLKDIDYQKDIINQALKDLKDADVVLLDLRLRDRDFNENLKPESLTGYKILQEIKDINTGIQVIIFSASNKIWNYETLLELGADGYILKNGFSQNIGEDISKLRETIEKAVNRKYLKDIYSEMKDIKEKLQQTEKDKEFYNELANQLDIAYSLFYDAAKSNNKTKFAYAYVALYICIEIINKNLIVAEETEEEKIYLWKLPNGEYLKTEWDAENKTYYLSENELKYNKIAEWQKLAGLYRQVWKQTNDKFIAQVRKYIKYRNWFIHKYKPDVIFFKDEEEYGKELKKFKEYQDKIYSYKGFIELWKKIKEIINLMLENS